VSAYDAAAASFNRHRALPDGVAEAVRSAAMAAVGGVPRPRLLDIGAGTGRIGWQDHFAAPIVTLKGVQHVPTQQLLGQEVLDQSVIGGRMLKEHKMTRFRNEFQSCAVD